MLTLNKSNPMEKYLFNRGSTRIIWFGRSTKKIQPSSVFLPLYRNFYRLFAANSFLGAKTVICLFN